MLRIFGQLIALGVLICGTVPAAHAQSDTLTGTGTAEPGAPLTAEAQAAVVESLAAAIEANYVLTEHAAAMAQTLRAQLAAGAYTGLTDREGFARRLTDDLRAVYPDGHLRVDASAPLPPADDTGAPVMPDVEEIRAMLGRINFGFRAVRVLPGNIGYLDLAAFMPPLSPDGEPLARDTAAAAMAMLANTDAVIIDLRNNAGGSPHMVQFLASYFFADGSVHLNDIYSRPDDRTESFYTLDTVPGERRPAVPVYLLTASSTFSAAEEFAYNLQTLGRATVVGEVTGGGAHPTIGFPLAGGFIAAIPAARAINPVTGTNWEGVGVRPDVAVNASTALDTALELAYERLLTAGGSEMAGGEWRWVLENLRARRSPVSLQPAALARFAGRYDLFTVTVEDGALYSSGAGRLTPTGATTFIADGGERFTFVVDEAGAVTGLDLALLPGMPPLRLTKAE